MDSEKIKGSVVIDETVLPKFDWKSMMSSRKIANASNIISSHENISRNLKPYELYYNQVKWLPQGLLKVQYLLGEEGGGWIFYAPFP